MNINDIITLARAGFNQQQISQIMGQATQQAQAPAPATAPAPAPASANVYSGQDIMQLRGEIDKMTNQLNAMTTAMQMVNINSDMLPKQQTSHEILSEIINPPAYHMENGVFSGGTAL